MEPRPISGLVQADQAHLIHPQHFAADHQTPVVYVEGKGAVLRDAEGREYIDGLSQLWNVNVGHGRHELADAAAAQMRRLAYASAYVGFTNEPAVRLAERLLSLAYKNLSGVYFTTAGAESNESAFKIARYFWKRRAIPTKTKIISRIHGYHGVTMAAMSATGMPVFHKMFGPTVPGFVHILPSYPYRYPGSGADALEEVITGFGRTGRWFALDHWGVQPDIVTFAKAVTSAYLPLGGAMVSHDIHQVILDAPAAER